MLLKPVLPVLEYVIFYDYIKNELCENKEIIEIECNGKCHLAKEMAKVSDSENPLSTDKNNRPLMEFSLLFFEDFQRFNLNIFHEITTKEYLVYRNLYSHLTTDFIFHPPVRF